MPEKTALLTALLLDRPLCRDCIMAKADVTEPEIHETLKRIRRVLVLREYERDRCRACGEVGPVFALEAPLNTRTQDYKGWVILVTPRRTGTGYRGDVEAQNWPRSESRAPLRITSTMILATEKAAVDDGFRLGREWIDRHG